MRENAPMQEKKRGPHVLYLAIKQVRNAASAVLGYPVVFRRRVGGGGVSDECSGGSHQSAAGCAVPAEGWWMACHCSEGSPLVS